MINYLTKILDEWTKVLRETKMNSHTDNVFTTHHEDDPDLLPKEMAPQFHMTTSYTPANVSVHKSTT